MLHSGIYHTISTYYFMRIMVNALKTIELIHLQITIAKNVFCEKQSRKCRWRFATLLQETPKDDLDDWTASETFRATNSVYLLGGLRGSTITYCIFTGVYFSTTSYDAAMRVTGQMATVWSWWAREAKPQKKKQGDSRVGPTCRRLQGKSTDPKQ